MRFTAVVPLLLLLLLLLCTAAVLFVCFWNSEEVWCGIVQLVFRMISTYYGSVRSCHQEKTLKYGCCCIMATTT